MTITVGSDADIRLDEVLSAAAEAARPVAHTDAGTRAGWLHAVADRLEAVRGDLVSIARRETNLPEGRLTSELDRTTFQARYFARRAAAGDLIGMHVDPADPDWPVAPRPDLRRVLLPIGPVLVFAASNFPFAFSVFGGDTVSALAAGCPVVVKAHPGHPELSSATAKVVTSTLADAGAPAGVFALIAGDDAAVQALRDPRIRAAAFTGSTSGGRALFDIAASRPDPIPFYGELGSVNPVVVTPVAWVERPDEIATGFAASMTLGAGQFCTKPGLVLVPDVDGFLDRLPELASGPLLNERIRLGFSAATREMAKYADIALGQTPDGTEDVPRPVLFRTDTAAVLARPRPLDLEMFGPAALLVGYPDLETVLEVTDRLPGQLTATVHGADRPGPEEIELVARLAEHAGRVLWNGWPTGVAVTDAQQHGGPYPASTASLTTSVGVAAASRFLRPVAFQDVPDAALPPYARRNR